MWFEQRGKLWLVLLLVTLAANLEAVQVEVASGWTGRPEGTCRLASGRAGEWSGSIRALMQLPEEGRRMFIEEGRKGLEVPLRLRGGFGGYDDGFRQGSPTKMAIQRIQVCRCSHPLCDVRD